MRGILLIILSAIALSSCRKVGLHVINTCRRTPTVEKFLPHEDCGKFYQCLNGIPISHRCPKGLHFDVSHGTCNWPEIARCQVKHDVSEDDVNLEIFDNNEPSQAPLICAMTNVNGVLVAHENCHKYYKCFNGKPVVMNCPADLSFSTPRKRCDWANNVKCGKRVKIDDSYQHVKGQKDAETTEKDSSRDSEDGGYSDPSQAPAICAADDSEGVLVAHENCNQFYKCSHGFAVSLKCPLNLLYNPLKEYCDWAKNVECGDRVTSDDDDDSFEIVTRKHKHKKIKRYVKYSYAGITNVHSDPTQATAICAEKDSDGVLVAHEYCHQFYKCSQGVPVTLDCPASLFYNPYGEYCDWAINVDCEGRLQPNNNTNTTENNQSGNEAEDEGSGCNQNNTHANPSEAPAICAAPGSDGVLVAHEYCNHFYKCSEGRAVALICPENLLYNPSKKYCDWPHEVECDTRVLPGVGGEGNGTEAGGESEGNHAQEGNSKPNEADAICAAENSDGVLVAHEYCNQFYKCSKSKPVAMICPGDLLFNSEGNYCDWPQKVDCKNRTMPENDTNDNNDDDCVNNDQNGNHSDPSLAKEICANEGSDGVLIAHQICNKFFKCSEGIPVALDCPTNLVYNSKLEYCDWPQSVDCGNRSVEHEEIKNENTTVVNPINHCAGKPEGTLVAHENCDQFYKCSFDVPVALTCPTGLFYNPSNEVCDWPSNVSCDNRIRREQTQKRYLEAKKALRFLLRVY